MEKPTTETQKIFIVDDTPANIMVLGEELKKDYQVFIATSGEVAMEKITANPPDLILLDIMMPGMDGYDVCRRLKKQPETENIPIIFITAKNAEEDETRGLDEGAVDYITKPFRLPIVRARIRTHLELKRKNDILENLSNLDGLTGIFNRRYFDTAFTAEWKRAVRGRYPLSVIIVDIDCFKLYNDHYGHVSGDECLKRVAEALASVLRRSTDFAARYGGEEFAVVLPQTEHEGAVRIGEKIREAVESLGLEQAQSAVAGHVTISAGVATTIPGPDKEAEQLLDAADSALYAAKASGRNRVNRKRL